MMSPSAPSEVRAGPAATTHTVGTVPLAVGVDAPRVRRFGSLRSLIVLLIGAMPVLLLIISAATGITRWAVEIANDQLVNQIHPADQAVRELTMAHVDQETEQRGFLIAGDPAFAQGRLRGSENAWILSFKGVPLLLRRSG